MLSEKVLTVADVREANTTKKSVSLSTRPGTTVSGLDRAKAKGVSILESDTTQNSGML